MKLSRRGLVRKYGLAPIAQVRDFGRQSMEGGNYDPSNSSDHVFADFLNDHEDPREDIVRRDLSHRGEKPEDFGNSVAAVHRKIDPRSHFSPANGGSYHELPDGTELSVTPYMSREGNPVSYDMEWTVGNRLGRYSGAFHPHEVASILDRLGIAHNIPSEQPAQMSRIKLKALRYARSTDPHTQNAMIDSIARNRDVSGLGPFADFLEENGMPHRNLVREALKNSQDPENVHPPFSPSMWQNIARDIPDPGYIGEDGRDMAMNDANPSEVIIHPRVSNRYYTGSRDGSLDVIHHGSSPEGHNLAYSVPVHSKEHLHQLTEDMPANQRAIIRRHMEPHLPSEKNRPLEPSQEINENVNFSRRMRARRYAKLPESEFGVMSPEQLQLAGQEAWGPLGDHLQENGFPSAGQMLSKHAMGHPDIHRWDDVPMGHSKIGGFSYQLLRDGPTLVHYLRLRMPDGTGRSFTHRISPQEREQMSRRLRFAAYRAPAGGMIARGTHYRGGEMIPDMESAFMNPPTKPLRMATMEYPESAEQQKTPLEEVGKVKVKKLGVGRLAEIRAKLSKISS